MSTQPENQLDRKDLKIRALLEKLGQQENQIADLRVELTLIEQHSKELEKVLYENSVAQNEPTVVPGEVVSVSHEPRPEAN